MSNNKEMFSSLLNFGINLGLKSEKENVFYTQCFAAWMMQQDEFDAHLQSESDVEVYYNTELVMMVKIENYTLMLEPVTESAFDAVLMVLKFISEKHDSVLKEFKKLNTKAPVSEVISDEESEDDLEWI